MTTEPISVVVQRLCVNGANALAGNTVVGYPAMTAFNGFCNVVARNIAGVQQGCVLDRFAVVHHTGVARLYGKYKDTMTQRRYVHDASGPPGRQPLWFSPPADVKPQVDLCVSLVIQMRVSAQRFSEIQVNPRLLNWSIPPRALGGVVMRTKRVAITTTPDEEVTRLGGYVVVDRTSDLFTNDGRDSFDVLLDTLEQPFEDGSERLFPTHIGYLAVSPVAQRVTGRMAAAHCFGEPIIGMAAFTRTYNLDDDSRCFWEARVANEVYILEGVN